ncbi:MAG: c(7)-type cytochrome triheme domain-containing protein [Candidatus Binatia bacterium]
MARLARLIGAISLSALLVGTGFGAEGDVVLKPRGGEGKFPPTVFPHWVHRIRYKCYACHPALFAMKAGADEISMDRIQNGEFCGTCHDGTVAWAVTIETCNRCHVGE